MAPASEPICPHCAAPIPRGAPEGLCLACLLAATPEPDDDAAGGEAGTFPRRFGGYVLERLLGRGGAGLVFAGRQDGLDRTVAVKVLAAGMFADRAGRERFRAEAQAVARMDHPGIVPVLEAGEAEDQAFFSMPLLPGGSLAGALRDGLSFAGTAAASFMAGLARAVHYAHQRGVLHRDIKPGNILLTESREPRLTDFGLARFLEGDSTLTRTNSLLGTPAYMAPEQAQNGTVTTAADVYGLGAVLYELLAGQPPFAGGTSVETVRLLLDTEPRRPSTLRSGVDRDLETICLKCLAKDPARRYGSAESLAEDLERCARGEPVTARPPGRVERLWKWARRHPALAASLSVTVLAILSAAVIATVFSIRLERAHRAAAELSEQRRAEVARLHAEECSNLLDRHDAIRALAAAIEALAMEDAAPAGPLRDAAVLRARERVAAVRRLAPQLRHAWPHPSAARDGIYSPDGSLAVCLAGDSVSGYDATTGALRFGPLDARPTDHGFNAGSLTFDKSGRWLALSCLDGAGSRSLRVCDVVAGRWLGSPIPVVGLPSFHPDGRRILVALRDGVRWLDTVTGAPGAVLFPEPAAMSVLTPDGRYAAVADAQFRLFILDAVTGERLAGPFSSGDGDVPWILLKVSPDSRWLASVRGGKSTRVTLWSLPEARPAPSPPRNENPTGTVFSPDGSRCLITALDNTRVLDLSGQDPPGDALAQPGLIGMGSWSPDGSMISTCGSGGDVHFWSADSAGELLSRVHHRGPVSSTVWSPDGQHVLTAGNDGLLKCWDLPPRDPSLLRLEAAPGSWRIAELEWSRDGANIIAAGGGIAECWNASTGAVCPVPAPVIPSGLPEGAVLAPDKSFYAVRTRANEFEIRDTATHRVRHALHHPDKRDGDSLRRFTFSRDGRLLLSYGGGAATELSAAVLWDTASGRDFGYSLTHNDDILAADFSPDGSLIATGGIDMVPRLWRVSDGSSAGVLAPHGYWIWRVQFSPDGTRLATCGADHFARVWDLRSLTAITPPLPHDRIVHRLAWHPDGIRLATADTRGIIRVWDLSPALEPINTLRQDVARLLPESGPVR